MRILMVFTVVLCLAGCAAEVLTTTAIQGELAAQSAKHATAQLNQAKEMKADIEISQAIRVYQAEHGAYPPSLEALVPEYLAAAPAGYGYNPSTGEFGPGVGGGATAAPGAIPQTDVQAMYKITQAINAYGTATGYYPPTLESLVPDYLPELPLASNGEPYYYNNQEGQVIHPSRIGQPTANYSEGGGGSGYVTSYGDDAGYDGGSKRAGGRSADAIDDRQRRNAAQYGGVSPNSSSGYTGSVPNPKATIDRTRSNLNKAIQGRSQ